MSEVRARFETRCGDCHLPIHKGDRIKASESGNGFIHDHHSGASSLPQRRRGLSKVEAPRAPRRFHGDVVEGRVCDWCGAGPQRCYGIAVGKKKRRLLNACSGCVGTHKLLGVKR